MRPTFEALPSSSLQTLCLAGVGQHLPSCDLQRLAASAKRLEQTLYLRAQLDFCCDLGRKDCATNTGSLSLKFPALSEGDATASAGVETLLP